MPHISRFKKRVSDRSGFDYYERGLIKDGPWKVAPDERDMPPPSKKSLGGEGDISGEPRVNSAFTASLISTVPTDSLNPEVAVGVGGINYNLLHPWMNVAATDSSVDITADPQISAGQQSKVLTLFCTSNELILDDGTGLDLWADKSFVMTSGSIITFIYNSGASVWQETSRSK